MAQGLEEELRDVELVSVRVHYTSRYFTVSGIPQAVKVYTMYYYFNYREFTKPSFWDLRVLSMLSAEVIGFG